MKVTLINEADFGGGAALACLRLFDALKDQDAAVELLVQSKASPDDTIHSTVLSKADEVRAKFNFLYERLPFILKERDKTVRFAFSTANAGTDISQNPVVLNADILHLHWINRGFLSVKNLDQLLKLKKPLVWTLHDMWPFTGGCHYSGLCQHFLNECGNCYFLKNPSPGDISHTGWGKKNEVYKSNNRITFIACSNWMRTIAERSSLLSGCDIVTIPNAVDIEKFSKKDKIVCRRKWNVPENAKVVLFGAANIRDNRKGLKYLIEALTLIKELHTEKSKDLHIVLFGKSKGFNFDSIPFSVTSLQVIKEQEHLVEIFSLADTFVLPSVEDNLPNMVMEALSCSTPVVAFDTGGLSDMVDHKQNGYLAKFQSVSDLADGILFVLQSPDEALRANARKKVVNDFNYKVVAKQHLELYQKLLQKV